MHWDSATLGFRIAATDKLKISNSFHFLPAKSAFNNFSLIFFVLSELANVYFFNI